MIFSAIENYSFLVEASPIPMIIFSGRDMTVTAVNKPLLNIIHSDTSIIGKALKLALPRLFNYPFHKLLDFVFTSGEEYCADEAPTK